MTNRLACMECRRKLEKIIRLETEGMINYKGNTIDAIPTENIREYYRYLEEDR